VVVLRAAPLARGMGSPRAGGCPSRASPSWPCPVPSLCSHPRSTAHAPPPPPGGCAVVPEWWAVASRPAWGGMGRPAGGRVPPPDANLQGGLRVPGTPPPYTPPPPREGTGRASGPRRHRLPTPRAAGSAPPKPRLPTHTGGSQTLAGGPSPPPRMPRSLSRVRARRPPPTAADHPGLAPELPVPPVVQGRERPPGRSTPPSLHAVAAPGRGTRQHNAASCMGGYGQGKAMQHPRRQGMDKAHQHDMQQQMCIPGTGR